MKATLITASIGGINYDSDPWGVAFWFFVLFVISLWGWKNHVKLKNKKREENGKRRNAKVS